MAWGFGTLPGAWGHDPIPFLAISLGPSLGFGQGKSQIARLMAISLEPWPKILDIRGCAWGKPVGSRRPGNPRLRDANSMLTYHYHAIPYGIKQPASQPGSKGQKANEQISK